MEPDIVAFERNRRLKWLIMERRQDKRMVKQIWRRPEGYVTFRKTKNAVE